MENKVINVKLSLVSLGQISILQNNAKYCHGAYLAVKECNDGSLTEELLRRRVTTWQPVILSSLVF